jgi:zeaxanthin glucosyltransferase
MRMATLVFVLENEEGHLLPTFKLAKRLAAHGHRIHYLGLEDAAELVRSQGFELTPILGNVFPGGSMRGASKSPGGAQTTTAAAIRNLRVSEVYDRYLGSLASDRGLGALIRGLQPDLFLVNSVYALNALVLHLRFDIPVVLLTSWLRSYPKSDFCVGIEEMLMQLQSSSPEIFALFKRAAPLARRLRDITDRVREMRELILCPAELDLPRPVRIEPEVYHIESSVDLQRREAGSFPWERLAPHGRLLYCSMGSQGHVVGREKVARFLRAVVEAAAGLDGWQLVLSTGGMVEAGDLPGLPENAVVSRWVPQLGMLARAGLMITHAGLGTVKEGIFHGVPMLAFPMANDQPENAGRIVHHRLGLAGDMAGATAAEIRHLVARAGGEPEFRANVERMGRRFREIEESGVGVRRIEEVLARHGAAVAAGETVSEAMQEVPAGVGAE